MTSTKSDRYSQIAFALEILRLLAEKPRKREELGELLDRFLDRNDKPSDDVLQKLTRTIRKLRECGFSIDSAPNRPYVLQESNFPVLLSLKQREALSLAADILSQMGFTGQAGQIKNIGRLSESDRSSDIHFDFSPPFDYGKDIDPEIVTKLQERLEQKYRYTILYRDSQGETLTWDLDRSELRFHNGVMYLFAHVPDTRHKNGLFEKNRLFRPDRILSVGGMSDTRWLMSEFPTCTIRYRMSGALAKYKPRRDREEVIQYNSESVDIKTTEDYIFWFRQRIMQYGANATVLTPDWLREDLHQELKRTLDHYQN
ncbi:WYL domain-containing protein [Spirulina sp. 06S082]|uniref:helix-turn-helix transcriptional regulator n=1 Tax=Spirulina sp. 06S082 TaxID=3110248 RepID=UPI002B1F7EE0|nr:WYL domain-containing protein [Spirulina sp. 06S082]MEA5468312.1 WYL domain-containing protein [Spirulina sp. 06S082]